MEYSVSGYSSQGGRDNNEDCIAAERNNDNLIAVICDGLGGMEAGEIASSYAVRSIIQNCKNNPLSPITFEKAFWYANQNIYVQTSIDNMRTTAAALWISGEDALVANIGDTRIYQFRDGRVYKQTKDHSVAWYSYLNGEIEYEDIRNTKDRNKLTRALGNSEEAKIDIDTVHIISGDAFLICSDGFWEYITESEMLGLLKLSSDAGEWLEKMRSVVEEKSGNSGDNHSAITIVFE